jgi:NitT/TauT family transport system substrate-binding protein
VSLQALATTLTAALALGALLACRAPGAPAPAPRPDASAAAAPPTVPAGASAPGGAPAVAAAPAPATAPPRAAAPLSPPVSLTVADNFTAAGVGLFVAIEQGYFAAEGLDVTLERLGTSAEIYPQLAAGRLDIAGSATGPALFNAVQRGVNLKIVADQSSIPPQYRATSGIVVARAAAEAGAFPSVASLRGRQLAVASVGSSAEFGMLRVLGQAGLRREDVNLTIVPFPELNAALVNGAVDAGWQAEPFLTLGLRRGQLHDLIRSDDPTGVVHAASVITYGEEFMARQADAADRFMVAYLRGIRDSYEAFFGSRQGRDAVVAALIKYTPVKDPSMYEDMAVQHQNPDGYVPLEGLRQIADWSVAAGYTQQPVDVDALVDHRYVERALARLGRYSPGRSPRGSVGSARDAAVYD